MSIEQLKANRPRYSDVVGETELSHTVKLNDDMNKFIDTLVFLLEEYENRIDQLENP